MAKRVPYATGAICCHTKDRLWKLSTMMSRMRSSEMLSDHMRSRLMVLELATLPWGLPWM